jgi:UDP-glucuronate decarboxylase
MKVLVTGAAGFLGSHISSRLINLGHVVIGLDDFSTGQEANLLELNKNPSFEFIHHDIRDPISVRVDAILNFACPASPIHYQADPVRTIETNFLGVINLLRLAKDNGSIFLQASTSEVYGDPTESPQTETYWGNVNPIGIRSCYDEGKRAAETLCFDYMRQHGVDSRVIRIFNTYGPNMAVGDGRVVSNFIVQALTGEPITLYGDGKQTRSFCYVSDLVDAVMSLLNLNRPILTPINIGNPVELSMYQLSSLILGVTKSDSKVILKDLPLDDPKQRCPDISLAKEILNWQPKIPIELGLQKTAAYFKGILEK